MNVKFKENLGVTVDALPLKESGHIVCENAARTKWEDVCPRDNGHEIYVLGNPPYLGARNQSSEQKRDIELVLGKIKGANNLDYIACWFHKAADYIKGVNAKSGFVTTNSICQGEQVSLLWPYILFEQELEIGFAHESFKWQNSAKHNAGVTVAVIGLRNRCNEKKYLFSAKNVRVVENISPYLIEGKDIVVYKESSSLCGLPAMCFGSMPNDGGKFFLSQVDVDKMTAEYPSAAQFIKQMYGADEFISGHVEYCLWIEDRDKDLAMQIKPIAERVEQVRKQRKNSNREATQRLAEVAHRFGEIRHQNSNAIIVPCHTSERREYLPFGFLDGNTVILNSGQAIYNPEPWVFAIISSRLHNVWVRTVAGRLETRIRYSSGLCYNPFPIPSLNDRQKESLSSHAFNVIAERENHPEKTIAELYDPDTMPAALLQAHKDMDAAVEVCYRSRPFHTDEQRIEYLLDKYAELRASTGR